ncbi:MAG: hypothetical protein ACYDH9_15945 [Limisphaerales bacterium]
MAPRKNIFRGRASQLARRAAAKRVLHPALVLLSFCLATTGVRAEHFAITLTVDGLGEKQEAYADDAPPPEGLHPRPVFHARAGDPLTWQFFMTNVNPHDELKQVTVRYFLVAEERVGQKEVPAPAKDAVLQGDFLLNFKLKGRVGLKQRFHIDRPGVYLLRVETLNSRSDHEHFSAVDLEIR